MKNASGKLVILGIVAAALAAASASWWFRYNATRRTADYWGASTAQLIRDAPLVQFWPLESAADVEATRRAWLAGETPRETASGCDVSHARGLVHLRNALLDDRSYRWPPVTLPADARWKWMLGFRDNAGRDGALVLISADHRWIAGVERDGKALSCEPITAGLAEMVAEFESQSAAAR